MGLLWDGWEGLKEIPLKDHWKDWGLGNWKKSKSGLKRIPLGLGGAQRFGKRKGRFRILRGRGVAPNPVGSGGRTPGTLGMRAGFPTALEVGEAGL